MADGTNPSLRRPRARPRATTIYGLPPEDPAGEISPADLGREAIEEIIATPDAPLSPATDKSKRSDISISALLEGILEPPPDEANRVPDDGEAHAYLDSVFRGEGELDRIIVKALSSCEEEAIESEPTLDDLLAEALEIKRGDLEEAEVEEAEVEALILGIESKRLNVSRILTNEELLELRPDDDLMIKRRNSQEEGVPKLMPHSHSVAITAAEILLSDDAEEDPNVKAITEDDLDEILF